MNSCAAISGLEAPSPASRAISGSWSCTVPVLADDPPLTVQAAGTSLTGLFGGEQDPLAEQR
jgi:hypothetical protein